MDLQECLRCGGALEHGVIQGQQLYLNWEPADGGRGATMHGKEHLVTGSPVRGPALAAQRCGSCGLGYFESSPGREHRWPSRPVVALP